MTKTNTTNNTTITPVTLQEFFNAYPNASIRKVAHATGINYGVLLKKSKEPIVGLPYDPEFTNWVALEEKLTSKGVDWATLNWDEMNQGNNILIFHTRSYKICFSHISFLFICLSQNFW